MFTVWVVGWVQIVQNQQKQVLGWGDIKKMIKPERMRAMISVWLKEMGGPPSFFFAIATTNFQCCSLLLPTQ